MAVADAQRIIRRLRHGEDIFSVADALGVDAADVVAVLRDPQGSAALPAAPGGGGGGGAISGVLAPNLLDLNSVDGDALTAHGWASPVWDGTWFKGATASARADMTYTAPLDATKGYYLNFSVDLATEADRVLVYIADWPQYNGNMLLEEIAGPVSNAVRTFFMPPGYDIYFETAGAGKFSPPAAYGTLTSDPAPPPPPGVADLVSGYGKFEVQFDLPVGWSYQVNGPPGRTFPQIMEMVITGGVASPFTAGGGVASVVAGDWRTPGGANPLRVRVPLPLHYPENAYVMVRDTANNQFPVGEVGFQAP